MTYLYSIISGVVSGVITSLLVFMFWQLQKPKLEISKKIAKNSKDEYRIKIVNKTRRYVSNVTILVQVVKRTNGINGDIFNTYNLSLTYPHRETGDGSVSSGGGTKCCAIKTQNRPLSYSPVLFIQTF